MLIKQILSFPALKLAKDSDLNNYKVRFSLN